MHLDDLFRISFVSDPQLHPDGRRVAFTVARINSEDDRYDRSIWLWDGGAAARFSTGPGDWRPRWSPDGGRLAFLRMAPGDESVPQVAVMPSDGGEAAVITDFALGASEAEWAPDGSVLAVVAAVWTEEWAGLDAERRKLHPRRIRRFGYRADDLGWRHDRQANLYLVDPAGSEEARALTVGHVHDSGVVWRPDGAAVGFLSARHAERGMDSGNQPWEVGLDGGDPVALAEVGIWQALSFRPDGVAFSLGIEDRWDYPDVVGLWRLSGERPTRLAAGVDRSLTSSHPPLNPPGLQWLEDGRALTVLEDAGRLEVVAVDEEGVIERLVGGDRQIVGVAPRLDGSAFAFVATSPTEPGELWWWENGEERRLTEFNTEISDVCVTPEHFRLSPDGSEVEIDVWIYLPDGDDPVPALLNVHGGPATQYGFGFFDEFQVYAGAGYGVVACNPRGSSGKGKAFARVPVDRWVEDRPPDLEDVLAALEAALARCRRLDPQRLGIMGGSYGGFMTARILAVDSRFRSAVPERGLYSFTSFLGTSDIGYRFPRHYLPGAAGEADWARLHAAGAIARADRISTPCLIVHAEGDLRCPIEQAEQLFTVLAANGVEAELLRFPGGSHELSRSGRPSHRRARFEAILEWHGRHLASGEISDGPDVTT